MAKSKSKKQEVIELIDEIIAPEKMSQEQALDFLGEIETYCQGMAEGIQSDIKQSKNLKLNSGGSVTS